MGTARLAIYLVGLVVVVAAVWIFLTATPIGQTIPSGIALALILLLVGVGIMASARSIHESRMTSRVVHDGYAGPPVADRRTYVDRPGYTERTVVRDAPPVAGETVVEERRYD